VIARARRWLEGLGGEPTVILCGASALLIVSHYQGSTGYMNELFGQRITDHPARPALGYFWWFASSIFLYALMPLVLSVATKGSFHRKYGLGLGDWKAGLAITGVFLGVMLPLTWCASRWTSFQGQYPLAGNAAYLLHLGENKTAFSWKLFLLYELGYFLYFLAWEFLFRGWMLHGLTPHWGRGAAILAQMAPFAVMHLGKAELEALGSIIAGVALGILSLRTRSFYYGAVIHGVVAVWMDWLSARGPLLGP
jgi:membrane protease YdiL (CAAX protease family)